MFYFGCFRRWREDASVRDGARTCRFANTSWVSAFPQEAAPSRSLCARRVIAFRLPSGGRPADGNPDHMWQMSPRILQELQSHSGSGGLIYAQRTRRTDCAIGDMRSKAIAAALMDQNVPGTRPGY